MRACPRKVSRTHHTIINDIATTERRASVKAIAPSEVRLAAIYNRITWAKLTLAPCISEIALLVA